MRSSPRRTTGRARSPIRAARSGVSVPAAAAAVRGRGAPARRCGAIVACVLLVVAAAGGAQEAGGAALDEVRAFAPGELRVADLGPLQRVVVVEGGRTMPLDSYARFTLLRLSGRRSYDRRPAIEWLARVLFTPNETHDDQVFVVDNPEVIDAMGLPSRGARPLQPVVPAAGTGRAGAPGRGCGGDRRGQPDHRRARDHPAVEQRRAVRQPALLVRVHLPAPRLPGGRCGGRGPARAARHRHLQLPRYRAAPRRAARSGHRRGVGTRRERRVRPHGRTAAAAQPEPGRVAEQLCRTAAGDHSGRRLRQRAMAHAVAGARRRADGCARAGAAARGGDGTAGAARPAGSLPGGPRPALRPSHPPVHRLRAAARRGTN